MVRSAAGWRGVLSGLTAAEGFQPAVPGTTWPFDDVPSRPVLGS
jgi:hypothetical protein